MEDFNKIIDSLQIRFVRAKNIDILKPVKIENNYEVENYLILVNSGKVRLNKDKEVASQGDVIFMPSGNSSSITYGSGTPTVLSKDDFLTNKDLFIKPFDGSSAMKEHYSYVAFDVKAFDSVNFFSSLDIPPFKIEDNFKLASLIKMINEELEESNVAGTDRLVKVLNEYMVIELIRYILSNGLFVEKIVTNSNFFKDTRLIKIFTHVRENLSQNLSNKVLANVANVSEEYVGQYFKMLTGTNPQDYIEFQRMEAAVKLLRTTTKSIRDIGIDVGYRDTAYFCRRFKMMFGIPAGKMRRRESVMDI